MLDILRIAELARIIIPGRRAAAMIRACSRELHKIAADRLLYPEPTAGILSARRGAVVVCGQYTYQKKSPSEIVLHDDGRRLYLRCLFTGKSPPAFKTQCITYPTDIIRVLREIFGNEINILVRGNCWPVLGSYTLLVSARVGAARLVIPPIRKKTIVVPAAYFAEITAGARTWVHTRAYTPARTRLRKCAHTHAHAYAYTRVPARVCKIPDTITLVCADQPRRHLIVNVGYVEQERGVAKVHIFPSAA